MVDYLDVLYSPDLLCACVGDQYPEQDGETRLVGNNSYSGRVEIMYHGIWMSVCGKLFDQKAADVVCRHIGYTHVETYCTNSW